MFMAVFKKMTKKFFFIPRNTSDTTDVQQETESKLNTLPHNQ